MIRHLRNWFQRNAYGVFTLRVLIAGGSALISVGLSYLPYDTLLQAIWVFCSSLFMGWLVLRGRLNESDDARYRRLFNTRFTWLQQNDPEALTTIFAENIRPRVLQWFESEHRINVARAEKIDALDSLARSGDSPGQLIFRTGVQLGQWLADVQPGNGGVAALEARLSEFVLDNEELLGNEVGEGLYLRHITRGSRRPIGVHMFHATSRLLLTVEYYDQEKDRHALALSVRSHLFEHASETDWESFKAGVLEQFPQFRPSQGGSGPQRQQIPFFIGYIDKSRAETDDALAAKLNELAALLPAAANADAATGSTETAPPADEPSQQ
ncbi:MAG: hypothetical protein NXI04_25645 [Planctomycetaceae bacterium]|nr:hypothetical protein [Planctomycetaceae bacterium]